MTPHEIHTDNIIKELIITFSTIIEEKDAFVKGHIDRVTGNCVHFATQLGLPKNEINQIYMAAILHDIGMIYLPEAIIRKTEKLTPDEVELMKRHPLLSEKILSHLSFLKKALPIIRHHHETYDGQGYPDGLKGDEIPLGARILCIVDTYDILTYGPPRRPTLSPRRALEVMENKGGQRFDKTLLNDFITFIRSSEPVSNEMKGETISQKQEKTTEADNTPKEAEEIYDFEKSADKKLIHETIARIVKKFKEGRIELPVLSKVVQEIQRVMGIQSSTVEDLAKVIEKDAVISVKVIAAANSPFYRGTEKVRTVNVAIPRLGFKETQNVVTAIANKSLYQTKDTRFNALMEKLWLHSLATAYCARNIAEMMRMVDREKFFLMGLVHDIGKVLLIKALSETSTNISSLETGDVVETIQDIHTNFGGAILRRWGFTEDFVRIALLHEGPTYTNSTDKDVLIINLANNLAYKMGYTLNGEETDVEILSLDSTRLLELDPLALEKTSETIKKQMEETASIF
ncbi:MAG: HDOD domain-containing protein [Deltaproteobacteria bacterium]|nr:HDOD domain-containing protein [Deltaproteobacteria bacterium]